MSLTRLIPGYAEALAAEAHARALPFLKLPVALCGVPVRALNLRDYQRLLHAASPFVCGGIPDRADVALLLWHQRAQIDPEEDQRRFAARFDALDLAEMAAALGAWVSRALMDAPRGGRGSAPITSLAASLIHNLRTAYPGMTREEVLSMELAELFQYQRLIQRDADPKAVFFNALSDPVKGEWLRGLNANTGKAGSSKRPPHTRKPTPSQVGASVRTPFRNKGNAERHSKSTSRTQDKK